MSRTGFVYDGAFLEHETGAGHPERPQRIQSLVQHLERSEVLGSLIQIEPEPNEQRWIEQIHPESHVNFIRNACGPGLNYVDSDTVVCARSFEIGVLAVGGVISGCRAVMEGKADNAFCAVRPPGHHAEPERAMGFCLFNNVAVAARYLQNQHGVERVAILDWDVHHGNGTQAAFYADESVFYCSLHQHPLYPGTGRRNETGSGAAEGTTLNIPLAPGLGDKEYLAALQDTVLPAIGDFDPDFILISAGFDAHRADPLANMEVSELGFARMTELVKGLAVRHCGGRLVSVLEGGYDLAALGMSVEAHINELRKKV
ncbi:histone deacetylase [bacterium]|nr:histone deacetylase [bacterium]